MSEYFVELYDRTYNPAVPTILTLKAQSFSIHAVGGYEQAQIAITGSTERLWDTLNWLRYYVFIRNEFRNIVWAGFVTQVDINLGGLQVGKSLDDMANKIAVAYTTDDANGNALRGTTAYASNTESVTLFGTKELLNSQGDTDATSAAALRDQALAILGLPVDTPGGIALGEAGGTLTCKGIWSTLAWKIFNQTGGVERHDVTGTYEHILGWGLSSNVIAFHAGSVKKISDLTGRLKDLRTDDLIVTSGAANGANNGTFTIVETATIDAQSITSTAIEFDPVDDVKRNVGGLDFIQADELLLISGAAASNNNGYFFAKSELEDTHITVTGSPDNRITRAAAGPSITIAQGNSVSTTATTFVTEYPANTITMSVLGTAVGQSFTLSVNLAFTVKSVFIRAKKVGAPADNLYVSIQAEVSGSPSNTALEAISIAGSTISDQLDWVEFTFANTLTLSYGVAYWLVVGRTGANSTANYYILDLCEGTSASYAGGLVKLHNGTAWVARATAADMPFQIWGNEQTTEQIRDMLTVGNQFFSTLDIQNASAKFSRQFRDADQTVLDEVELLMKAGVSTGERLLSSVTPDRAVHVFKEPAYSRDTAPLLFNDGHITDVTGVDIEPGRLPAGKWVTLAGVPTNVSAFLDISHRFVERAEWDCEGDKLSAIEFKGATNPWDVIRLV